MIINQITYGSGAAAENVTVSARASATAVAVGTVYAFLGTEGDQAGIVTVGALEYIDPVDFMDMTVLRDSVIKVLVKPPANYKAKADCTGGVRLLSMVKYGDDGLYLATFKVEDVGTFFLKRGGGTGI